MKGPIKDIEKKRIVIGFLIDTIACDTAGTQKQLLETIRRLDRKQFKPLIICLWVSGWMRKNRLPCEHFVLGYSGFIKPSLPIVVSRLIRIIRKEHIDIVQTFFEDSMFVGLLGKIFSKKPVVLLASRRDIGLGEKNQPWYHSIYNFLRPFTNHFFSGIVVNSMEIQRLISEREKTNLNKIKVIPNGISLPDQSNGSIEFYKKNHSDVWICVVASLTPVKRHDILIKAVADLLSRGIAKEFKVILLGDGPQRQRLGKMVKDLGLEHYVHFEGTVENVYDYLHFADIGVLCSDKEGLSNAIMEYMACGLPVIATAIGGNTELVDKTNGILIPPGDYVALADALEQLITDPRLRRRLGKEGRKKIKENFSWEKTINALENYYLSLLRN